MATVTPVITDISADGDTRQIVWTLTSTDSDGAWVKFNDFRDRCVSFTGTFAGGSVAAFQGSNVDGAAGTFFTLNEPTLGTDISTASAAMFQVVESPRIARPQLTTPGTAATIVCTLILSRN